MYILRGKDQVLFIVLTCGEGSSWGMEPSSRVFNKVSPRIWVRCWAMTVCCSTPQWFSMERMTGKFDACQRRSKKLISPYTAFLFQLKQERKSIVETPENVGQSARSTFKFMLMDDHQILRLHSFHTVRWKWNINYSSWPAVKTTFFFRSVKFISSDRTRQLLTLFFMYTCPKILSSLVCRSWLMIFQSMKKRTTLVLHNRRRVVNICSVEFGVTGKTTEP